MGSMSQTGTACAATLRVRSTLRVRMGPESSGAVRRRRSHGNEARRCLWGRRPKRADVALRCTVAAGQEAPDAVRLVTELAQRFAPTLSDWPSSRLAIPILLNSPSAPKLALVRPALWSAVRKLARGLRFRVGSAAAPTIKVRGSSLPRGMPERPIPTEIQSEVSSCSSAGCRPSRIASTMSGASSSVAETG